MDERKGHFPESDKNQRERLKLYVLRDTGGVAAKS